MSNVDLLRTSRRLLLDTSAVIYFLAGVEPYLSSLLLPVFERVRGGEALLVLSVVTEAELLVRPMRMGNARDVDRVSDLLSEEGIVVIDVDRVIARKAAALRVENSLSLTDAMIIATAVESGCEVIAGNDRAWAKRATGVPYVHLDDAVGQ